VLQSRDFGFKLAKTAMEEHLGLLRKRFAGGPPDLLERALASYDSIPVDQRASRLLYWPLVQESDQNKTAIFSHCPLYRVPATQFSEYFYYDFLVHCQKTGWSKPKTRRLSVTTDIGSTKKPKPTVLDDPNILVLPPSPPTTSLVIGSNNALSRLVRLLDWDSKLVPAHLQSPEAFAEAAAEAASSPHLSAPVHWSRHIVTPYHYKGFFALLSPFLSLQQTMHAHIQLYAGDEWHFTASNCTLVIHQAEHFHGLTLHMPGQLCPIELGLGSFSTDADGHRSLSLATLAGPDQLCYGESHGSQVMLVFGDRPGVLRLCPLDNTFPASGGDGCGKHCALDIEYGVLEYWCEALPFSDDCQANTVHLLAPWQQPIRYEVVGCEEFTNQMMLHDSLMMCSFVPIEFFVLYPVEEHQQGTTRWWLHDGNLCAALHLYEAVRNLRLEWCKPELPYFSLYGQRLVVARAHDCFYLLDQETGYAWVSFQLSSPNQSERAIRFSLIDPRCAPFFDLTYHLIY
jgi:hypothetical protein